MNRQTLSLEKIQTGGGTQSRAALNEDVVAEYAETIKAGTDLPPVTVFQDGKKYWLADGFHRFHAHRKAGAIEIEADVRVGTKRDAILHSVGANAAHGLRRSNADKRAAVKTLLADKEWGQWSDRQIADACCVSHPLVASIRTGLTGNSSSEPGERRYVTKHGTESTMDVAALVKRSENYGTEAEPTTHVATSDPRHVAPSALSTPTHVAAPEMASDNAALADTSNDEHDDADDSDMLADLVQENARLIELLNAAEADDLAAEALKWRRVAENAERQQSQAMDSASASQKRERWTKTQLMRCGAAVGEEDPAKIARAVELALQARAAA